MTAELRAGVVATHLADQIEALARELLPGGHRESLEWCAGSIAGEAGSSLGVHLVGRKAGVWADFATGDRGDALDLVKATLGLDTAAAMAWARRWLGIDEGAAEIPQRRRPDLPPDDRDDPDRWQYPWRAARPIAGTLAKVYLAARKLTVDDRKDGVLRFAARRARKSPADEFEHHPALLALRSDIRTGEPCGIINIYLQADGSDRLRDRKGKTVTGRARGSAVMLSAFDEPTMGLTVCEGCETAVAIHQSGLRPVWALGGASNLAAFPVLGGIEALTIAADQDGPGMRAAETLAQRWLDAGREAAIVAPPAGDWADDG
jgi:hypothetical protein